MKYWKSGVAVTAALASLTLAACSSSVPEATSAPSSTGGATELTGTVTYWHAYTADSPEVSTLQGTIIPEFEKLHPGVTVKDVPIPYDELHQKLITAAAGEQLPDLVRADIGWVPELANLGVLEPLSTSMPDFQTYADQVYPGTLATNMWKGTYYGLPLDTNTRVLLYNKSFFEKAGVTVPTTVEELMAAGPALKEAGAYAFADNGAGGWNMLPWIWSAGGDITDPDVTKATGYLNSPESVKGIQNLVDMYNAGFMPAIVLGDSGGLQTSDGLATDKYATILDGPWMYPIFAGQYPDFTVSASPVPAGPGGSISVVGGEDIVMTQSSTNKEAAMEFMRYLLSEDAQLAMAEVGQMPVLSNLGPQLSSINAYYAQFVDQLQTAKPRPPTPVWSQIDSIMQDEIRAAFRGDKTVQEALDEAASQADALLAEFN